MGSLHGSSVSRAWGQQSVAASARETRVSAERPPPAPDPGRPSPGCALALGSGAPCSTLHPRMFLFLIPAGAGMWLPGLPPGSYFGGSFAWGGLGSPPASPRPWPADHPWPWLQRASLPGPLPTTPSPPAKKARVKQGACRLNLTVPASESMAESQRSCPCPSLRSGACEEQGGVVVGHWAMIGPLQAGGGLFLASGTCSFHPGHTFLWGW